METENRLRLTFTVTEDDVIRYTLFHGNYVRNVSSWLGSVFFLSVVIIPNWLNNATALFMMAPAAFSFTLVPVLWYRSSLIQAAKRWCRETVGVTGESTLEVSPEGL
jgi:hypothetical protein